MQHRLSYRVVLTKHSRRRWWYRVGRAPGKLGKLLTMLLLEELPCGLPVRRGYARLFLRGDRLDLPHDMWAFVSLPNMRGEWVCLTFRPVRAGERGKR
jgi:hypothetical protein